MKDQKPTLVIGHRNPDTDAIAAAVGYAWVLNAIGPGQHVAGRAGEVNAQTAFVLDHFGIEPPPLVGDLWTRVGDVADRVEPLRKGQTVLSAIQGIAQTARPAPVLDEGERPVGLISGAGLFSKLAEPLSSTSVLALADVLGHPVEATVDSNGVILSAAEPIRNVIGQALRAEQDEFLVVNAEGQYAGIVRKSALLAPPRRNLIIVDHNEADQGVPGMQEMELIEVLDHHRLGALSTTMPIRFVVEPVGCCSTLVYERAHDHGLTIPAPIAGLLMAAILSDTLVFRSPTTTPRDRQAAEALAIMAGFPVKDGSPSEAIVEFGAKMLDAGAGMSGRSAQDIITADIKYYHARTVHAGIAQVETANMREIAV
ncbi:MAG: DHH family phosphoesterase, partial [Anaerolineae bacterium]|nr:DHH family phosphoesterase [Anaerolineae bacterium]